MRKTFCRCLALIAMLSACDVYGIYYKSGTRRTPYSAGTSGQRADGSAIGGPLTRHKCDYCDRTGVKYLIKGREMNLCSAHYCRRHKRPQPDGDGTCEVCAKENAARREKARIEEERREKERMAKLEASLAAAFSNRNARAAAVLAGLPPGAAPDFESFLHLKFGSPGVWLSGDSVFVRKDNGQTVSAKPAPSGGGAGRVSRRYEVSGRGVKYRGFQHVYLYFTPQTRLLWKVEICDNESRLTDEDERKIIEANFQRRYNAQFKPAVDGTAGKLEMRIGDCVLVWNGAGVSGLQPRNKPRMGDVWQAAAGLEEVRVEPRLSMKDLRLEKLAVSESRSIRSHRIMDEVRSSQEDL